jgi:hypothetical protein
MADDLKAQPIAIYAHGLDTSGSPGASRAARSTLLTQVPGVFFWQHCPKINRCRDERAWLSIAGRDQTLYKLTAVQVSVAGICELRV